jgi:hypothetical protein
MRAGFHLLGVSQALSALLSRGPSRLPGAIALSGCSLFRREQLAKKNIL